MLLILYSTFQAIFKNFETNKNSVSAFHLCIHLSIHHTFISDLTLWSTLVSCITLSPAHATPKSRTLKTQTQQPPSGGSLSTPPPSGVVTDAPGISVYRLKASDDVTCILLKTDGVIEVMYIDR